MIYEHDKYIDTMKISLKHIHKIHMGVSYDCNYCIHRYVEHIVNSTSSCFKFDRKSIFSINCFKRFDMSFQIINSNLDLKFIKNIFSKIENESIHTLFNLCTKQHLLMLLSLDIPNNNEFNAYVNDIINEYDNIKCDIKNKVNWIIDKYSIIIDIFNHNIKHNIIHNTKYIICIIYFLGMLEWFHFAIIDYYCSQSHSNSLLILGEIIDMDYVPLIDYDFDELYEFLREEYCSHTIVFIIDRNMLFIYDSDYDSAFDCINNDMYDRLCNVIHKSNKIPEFILNKSSIQSLTDDQYCIFYCINFILKLAMHMTDWKDYTYENLQYFTKNLDERIDMHRFIMRLDHVAKIFIDVNVNIDVNIDFKKLIKINQFNKNLK